MFKHRNRLIILFALFFTFCLTLNAGAAGIKERMKARIPALTALLADGILGENNMGFLEFRKQKPDQAALVNDENKDRRDVYAAIAKQQGANPELVGKRRAQQIAQIAAAGTWLQKPNGSWYRK